MTVPATINKVHKVIQYGFLRESILPSGVLPSGLAVPQFLIRPIENIAICESNGKYVPVFCTRDWQMVPAGFDSTLEQNRDLTLERARRVPVELLGQDVLFWHDLPQSPAKDFFERKLQQPNSVEALTWLQQKDGVFRTFGGDGVRKGFAGKRATNYVQRLYHHGAVKVTAVEVQRDRADWVRKMSVERGLPETDTIEATDELVVELPDDPPARAGLFSQWVTAFGRKKWDAPVDDGQKYLYFGWI